MPYIKKRGKSWRVVVRVGGERAERTVRCSHQDAKRVAREMERDLARIAKRKKVGLRGVVHLSELADHYEENVLPTKREATRVSYLNTLAAVRVYFKSDPVLDDIQTEHIQGYLDWRRVHDPHGNKRSRPLSERTREKERAVLHRMFGTAVKLGWRESNPVTRVEKPKHTGREPVLLDYEQTEKLLAECRKSRSPMLYLYVVLLLETGVRSKSEGLWIEWDDVDLEKGRIKIKSSYRHATKSGKSRYVSTPPRLREAMREHFARYRLATYDGHRTPWVFHHTFDNRSAKAGERIESMYRGFKRAAERAKLPADLRVHDLRHLWVTLSLADGVPTAHVKEAAGHADYATTDRYAHLNADQYLSGFEARYSANGLPTAGAENSQTGTDGAKR
jgi:integrase